MVQSLFIYNTLFMWSFTFKESIDGKGLKILRIWKVHISTFRLSWARPEFFYQPVSVVRKLMIIIKLEKQTSMDKQVWRGDNRLAGRWEEWPVRWQRPFQREGVCLTEYRSCFTLLWIRLGGSNYTLWWESSVEVDATGDITEEALISMSAMRAHQLSWTTS